jgi:stage II sporulation protein M
MKRQKKSTSNNHFKESWDFIKTKRNYIYFSAIIFLIFIIIGYFVSPSELLEAQLLKLLQELTLKFQGLNAFQTIWALLSNNLTTSFFSLILGTIFGIFPLIGTVLNGYLIGYVANKVVAQEGVLILWRLFPHGIFELPAFLISSGLGISLGMNFFSGKFTEQFKSSMKAFFLIVLPLLLIAAIIEGALVSFFG